MIFMLDKFAETMYNYSTFKRKMFRYLVVIVDFKQITTSTDLMDKHLIDKALLREEELI